MAGAYSLYRTEYCDMVIEWGKLGKSVAWMASNLDVSRDTVYEWAKVHSEFSEALTRARLHAQAWWEDQGQDNLFMAHQSGSFNAGMWARNMAARFAEDWREKTETTLQGANGGPVEISSITRRVIDPKK